MIKWIPYEKLIDPERIGKGGCSTVFKATWSDGIRIARKEGSGYVKSREKQYTVALKTLPEKDYLTEFRSHLECRFVGSGLKIYGLTKNKENKYLMAFQFADGGSLDKYLTDNFTILKWENKLQQLLFISSDLAQIHKAEYVHNDLHSGNILYDGNTPYIADLGLSKKMSEQSSDQEVKGVLPYVAPEVLQKQKASPSSDIYSFGIIMTTMSTNKRPFADKVYGTSLAVRIVKNGLRPEFAKDTPECYKELANQCMDSDPQKRPTAIDIAFKLYQWAYKDNEIKYQFLKADKINLQT